MQGNGEHPANNNASSVTAPTERFASPFDRAAWFDLLTAHGFAGAGRADARGAEGETSAHLPLRIETPGHFAALANWYSFSIRPLFIGDGNRDAAQLDLFRKLRARATRLTLYPVSDAEKDGIAAALRSAGWWVHTAPKGDRHWLDLKGMSHDDWWNSRPGALRSTVRRKEKKGIVDVALYTTFDAEAWAAYEAIYAASWKPAEGCPALLRAFAQDESKRGTFRMGLARIEGTPVAAQFWTVEGGTAFIHKLAHTEDSIRASPGTLLSAALFRHVIEVDGAVRVDFGTGNDGYKRDWMNRHEPLWHIDAFNRARIAAWGPALKTFVRSAIGRK
ncbi:MAG: GNAT family N-acetyltransferase [Sphingopyxis sp.]|uniref:GNAT family N-acetyltransferase n=1 Tax=Sphingopyxis sp. TaxID=1908224 RepID=UPI002AB914FE|nr:GNAT family N-acetyltransferase [Sphingopyxis sp.]MDZ3832539.1 GNAT family N-acetyltransferase [Sphingopyxis sp.]